MNVSGNFRNRSAAIALAVAVLATGCSATPTEPSAAGAAASLPGLGGAGEPLSTGLTPADLTARGWDCRVPPPFPDRIVCRAPNQDFPNPTVPVDQRPPTFTLLVFQNTGDFIGTVIGIRADLYRGQVCGPTGEPYIFRPPIGYYECLHPAGR